MKRVPIIGLRFGRLHVDEEGPPHVIANRSYRRVWCTCDCGTRCLIWVCSLRRKTCPTRSCGCLLIDTVTHHGMARRGHVARIYKVWLNMNSRCTNPATKGFHNYGARGICVCDSWKWPNGFECFLREMGEGKKGWTLERIGNNGNYELWNCCWATKKRQSRNKRTNHIMTVRGITDCLIALCEHFHVNYSRVHARLTLGWPIEAAFFEPKNRKLRSVLVA